MRITYDPKYDVIYIKLSSAEKVSSKEIDEDITIDIDAKGKLAGIEILSASEHIELSALLPIEIKEGALK